MCAEIRLLFFAPDNRNIVFFHFSDKGIAGYSKHIGRSLLIKFTVLQCFSNQLNLMVFKIDRIDRIF
jgi:hypothetical protein